MRLSRSVRAKLLICALFMLLVGLAVRPVMGSQAFAVCVSTALAFVIMAVWP